MIETPAARMGVLARAWDSDIAYSFRGSPVTIVSAIVAAADEFLASVFAAVWDQRPQGDPFERPAQLNLMDGLTPRACPTSSPVKRITS